MWPTRRAFAGRCLVTLVFFAVVAGGCDAREQTSSYDSSATARAIELAKVGTASTPMKGLPSLAISRNFLVSGSRAPLPIEPSGLNAKARSLLADIVRPAINEAGGIAFSVDHRVPFATVRNIFSACLDGRGAGAFELRVKSGGETAALRVCAVRGAARFDGDGEDCWARSLPRSPSSTRHRSGSHGDADISRADASSTASQGRQGDITGQAPDYQLEGPLELTLSVEHDYLRLQLQGRSLRTLTLRSEEKPGDEPVLAKMRTTFETLRQNNRWDRQVAVRYGDEVLWGDVIATLEELGRHHFDFVLLTHINPGGSQRAGEGG